MSARRGQAIEMQPRAEPFRGAGGDFDPTEDAHEPQEARDTCWADWGTEPLIEQDEGERSYTGTPTLRAMPQPEPDVFMRSREAVRSNTYDSWDTWDDFNPRSGEDDGKLRPEPRSPTRNDSTGSASKAVRSKRITPAGRRCCVSLVNKFVVLCAVALAGLAFMPFRKASPMSIAARKSSAS